MKTIELTVSGQSIRALKSPVPVISGTKGYVELAVDFTDQDWDGLTKTALFTADGLSNPIPRLIGDDGKCLLPDAIAAIDGYYNVYIQGEIPGGMTITAGPISLMNQPGPNTLGEPQEIVAEQTYMEQWMAKVQSLVNEAKVAAAEAKRWARKGGAE